MDNIALFGMRDYPIIEFKNNGMLKLKGNSFPMNANVIYEPLIDFVSNLSVEKIELNVELDIVDSNTVRNLYLIFKEIDKNDHIKVAHVFWNYAKNEPDKKEVGEMLQEYSKKSWFVYRQLPINVN